MAIQKPALFVPVTISTGVSQSIPFNRGGAKTATIAAATYYTPAALAAAIQAAMTAADGATTWTVTVSASGRFSISGTAAFILSWGSNLASEAQQLLGWPAGATGSALTQTAPNQHQGGWYADDPVVDDTRDLPVLERAQTVALSGRPKVVTYATRYLRTIVLGSLQGWKVFVADEGSSYLNEAIQRVITGSGCARFRWFPDQTDLATGSDYALDLDSARRLPRDRLSSGVALYSLALTFRPYV
jgi:hypothetical protein